jgi:hypothetical protein
VNSFDHLRQVVTFVMPPKKSSALGAALQPLDVNQETLREARSQRGRLQVQLLRRRSWTKKSRTSKPSINMSRGRRRCFVFPIFRRRSMRLLRKCVISLKMTRTKTSTQRASSGQFLRWWWMVLGPCFVAEGPAGRNSFVWSCPHVMTEGSSPWSFGAANRLKNRMTV